MHRAQLPDLRTNRDSVLLLHTCADQIRSHIFESESAHANSIVDYLRHHKGMCLLLHTLIDTIRSQVERAHTQTQRNELASTYAHSHYPQPHFF